MDDVIIWLKELECRTRDDPTFRDGEVDRVFSAMDDEAVWVVRMLVARLIPRLGLRGKRKSEATAFLFRQAESSNAFIRAWALDSLAQYANRDRSIYDRVCWMLREAYETDKPAVRGCAKRGLILLKRPLI